MLLDIMGIIILNLYAFRYNIAVPFQDFANTFFLSVK